MVTASGVTSTTWARKSSTTCSTAVRETSSAFTLTSNSSRCTEFSGASSTILITLTNLFSCLVTCSRALDSTSTTTVIREISSCSVGPTAREWMLNARRANSAATRVRTPGLFSTSTERVCRDIGVSSLIALEVRGDAAGILDVIVGDPGRHHRPHHGIGAHHEVHHHGAVVDLVGLVDHRVHLAGGLTPQAHRAVRFGELDEVRDALGAVPGVQLGMGVALVIEQGLPLAHHPQRGDVDRSE